MTRVEKWTKIERIMLDYGPPITLVEPQARAAWFRGCREMSGEILALFDEQKCEDDCIGCKAIKCPVSATCPHNNSLDENSNETRISRLLYFFHQELSGDMSEESRRVWARKILEWVRPDSPSELAVEKECPACKDVSEGKMPRSCSMCCDGTITRPATQNDLVWSIKCQIHHFKDINMLTEDGGRLVIK